MLEQEDINILSLEPEDDEEYDSDYWSQSPIILKGIKILN